MPASPPSFDALTRRDASLAGALFVASLAVYLAFPQPWLWGDGYGMVQGIHSDRPDLRFGMHVGVMALGRLVAHVAPALGPFGALHLVAAACASLGLGATYLVARRVGAVPWAALAATALYAVTPACWFFATVIELHTVHFAAVAIVVLAIVSLPWDRLLASGAVLWVLCLSLPLTHLSAPLLAPGLVVLVYVAARAKGSARGLVRTGLVAAPLIATSMFAGLAIAGAVRGRSGDRFTLVTIRNMVAEHVHGARSGWWWDDVVVAHAWSGALFVAGIWAMREQRHWLLVLATFVVPALAFHAWWGVPNGGGYFVPLAPFVVVPGAFALTRLAKRRALLPLVCAGAALAAVAQFRIAREAAAARMAVFDTVDRAARARQVRSAIGERGFFVSFDLGAQPITRELPGVDEVNALHDFLPLARSGRTPQSVADEMEHRIAARLERSPLVAWDASYRRLLPFAPDLAPYFLAVERRLAERFTVRELDHDEWPLLVLSHPDPGE